MQYLLSEARSRGPDRLNLHFRPQYLLCPFCQMDFDIVAKVETYAADTEDIIHTLRLQVLSLTVIFTAVRTVIRVLA